MFPNLCRKVQCNNTTTTTTTRDSELIYNNTYLYKSESATYRYKMKWKVKNKYICHLSLGLPACLRPLPSAWFVHARASSSNVTQSQTGARDVISLVPVCSVFPFRPLVRCQQHHCSYICIKYIHTHVPVCAYIQMRIHSMRHMFWAVFPFYLLLLLPFPIYFAHIFVLAAFCCSVYISHGSGAAAASPCLSLDPFYSVIRRVSRMPLFLIRFFTSLRQRRRQHPHKQTNAVSLSHTFTNTCILAQLLVGTALWLCHSIK